VNEPFLNVIDMNRKNLYGLISLIVSFIFIFSAQAHAQGPACTISLAINPAAATINPGDDIQFKVCLAGVSCGHIPVTFEVTDPMGIKHEYTEITPSAAPWCTSWISYLTKFNNLPNTDESGRYYIVARAPDVNVPDNWEQDDFVVNVVGCEQVFNDSALMAEREVTIGSIPEMTPSDIVACCHLDCCLNLTLDIDCRRIGGNFPPAELNVGTTEPSSFGYTAICHRVLSNLDVEYTSINASKYVVVGKAVEKDNITNYTIIDIGRNECILGDITKCGLTTKRLLIDEDVYRSYVVANLSHANPVCGGFYTPEIPPVGWVYDSVQNTPRYLAVYKDLTDFLYCWMAPPLISESKWCHLVNLGWYSVVDLTSERNVTYITPEAVEEENKWNNLSGYIVLGHACPLYRNTTSITVTAMPELHCFDATTAPFDIPCTHPFNTSCGIGTGPCIYVWKSSHPLNGTIGYTKSFCEDTLAIGPHTISLEVADAETDTQIPAFNLTREEIQSIRSNVTINAHGPSPGCAAIPPGPHIFDYGPPYRDCVNGNNPRYYRLFDQNTTWVKIFTVTPMLEDRRDLGGGEGWYWNWSRTSAPDNKINITIYIGGGCKRTSAFHFNYTPAVHSYYDTPIIDYVNVTIFDGANPPVTYNVSGWNLLPFPPADSVVNISNGMIVEHHRYEGIRYSYFAINHTVPENAAYLHIEANYTCETTLKRNNVPCGTIDEIKDKSTVYDNFTIEFLDHENPKDNCKWTNPLEWRNISGYWNRTWDATLGKYILHLNKSAMPNRRMVSVEDISDNKTIEVLVKGNAAGGEIADTTIGFYSNSDASSYWFLDLHEDSSGGKLAIGYRKSAPPSRVIRKTEPTTYVDDEWYWVKIYINGSNISAKIWNYSAEEPESWQINYSIGTNPGDVIFGNHWVIGTEHGTNNEEFWFDPDPRCGIKVSGYYNSKFIPALGYSVVTGGHIDIEIEPDILSGFTLRVGETPRVEYDHVMHPAKHILYRKEKAAPSPPYLDMQEFYYDDKYGYESVSFGFNELCKLPACPANCYCKPDDIFTPECIDMTKEPPVRYYPDDCVCVWNECYPDPCTSSRTYHEYEGIYYDFVEFYNRFPPNEENYIRTLGDPVSSRWIDIGNISAGPDLSKVNSPRGRYQFDFSCRGINLTDFINNGTFTVYTHFRNFTYKLSSLTRRGRTSIFYVVSPAPEDIEPGDLVTINVTLLCGVFPLGNEDVGIIVTNYQNELIGVNRIGDKAYVTTDALGFASFSFVIRQDAAKVTLFYEGSEECGEAEVNFILGGEKVESIITSVEFFLLMIIFILAIFSYRFFKKGRLDFYEMWQEFRGEKD